MPKTGRRNLLKMIGLTPALLVPWKPVGEQPAPSPAPVPPPEITTAQQEAVDDLARKLNQILEAQRQVSISPTDHYHASNGDGLEVGPAIPRFDGVALSRAWSSTGGCYPGLRFKLEDDDGPV